MLTAHAVSKDNLKKFFEKSASCYVPKDELTKLMSFWPISWRLGKRTRMCLKNGTKDSAASVTGGSGQTGRPRIPNSGILGY